MRKLDGNIKRLFLLKLDMARKRPLFRRQEWFRYKKLGTSWRRPKGKHSKMREHRKYRPPVVDSGFRGPRAVRYLHPSGYRDVLVHNVKELSTLNPEVDAVRIASTVGRRKKIEIYRNAVEKGFRVLNFEEVR
ncbi:MAG: 50S ribosomal protein L32e [Thermoplasmata archaeon]|jgi:large subunit ribosomal protein L32e|nr:50S ribosomal protein L32e [Thermoplasmata archaeon]MVT13807.1 50S ribosomal protein L32e [Euryarchaeota archaeon]MVT15212.1 50S ribosomal protein L32e [Euryarchaeota archaeon]MVT35680.1 50S ribosomal protein L32e [Euryarchaeota archaeon]